MFFFEFHDSKMKSNKELLKDDTPSKQSEVIDKEKSGEQEGMMITKTNAKKEKKKSMSEFDIRKKLFPKFQVNRK